MQRGQPEFQWTNLASEFPATLVTETAPEKLKDGQTPDSYGMGLDKGGLLYKSAFTDLGSATSTWASATTPTSAPASITTWRYHLDRLWGYKSTLQSLYYGAYGNYSYYMQQGAGRVLLDAEAANIVGVQPFGTNLAILKSALLYVLPNADDTGAGFVVRLIGEQGTDSEAKAIGLKDTIFFANANGIWSSNGADLTEITQQIRNSLGNVKGSSITTMRADFAKSRLIGYLTEDEVNTVYFVIVPDAPDGIGIYTYDGSNFRFTSRSLATDDGTPIMVDKIALNYEYNSTSKITVSWQVKINDTWKGEEQFVVLPDVPVGRIELPTNNMFAARRWAFRLTSIPSAFYIRSIEANVKATSGSGYAAK